MAEGKETGSGFWLYVCFSVASFLALLVRTLLITSGSLMASRYSRTVPCLRIYHYLIRTTGKASYYMHCNCITCYKNYSGMLVLLQVLQLMLPLPIILLVPPTPTTTSISYITSSVNFYSFHQCFPPNNRTTNKLLVPALYTK